MSNLASNHLSPNGFSSNQRKTPRTSPRPLTSLNTSPQQRDVTSIAYFIAGYALHHKSQRHSERTIAFHTDSKAGPLARTYPSLTMHQQ